MADKFTNMDAPTTVQGHQGSVVVVLAVEDLTNFILAYFSLLIVDHVSVRTTQCRVWSTSGLDMKGQYRRYMSYKWGHSHKNVVRECTFMICKFLLSGRTPS